MSVKRYEWVPQPAVAITQHFDTIALDTAKMVMCDVNRRDEFLGGDIQLLSRIQCRIDEACRTAMLQSFGNSEQLSSPVIPEGWVACSDRMPKKGEEVLCTDQFENYETALYDTGYIPGPPFFATTAGEFHPTHWMPLPAAPQQEVK
ncbi:DUF551 domain-containing protein [Escherichia coli]|nr:DUF551 domain-containing protein [Escherichia coli]